MEKDIVWEVIRDADRCHRHYHATDAFGDDKDVPIRIDQVNSEWPEDDWLNLLDFNPDRYLSSQEDEMEQELEDEIERNKEWYEADLNRTPLEDDDVYLSRIRAGRYDDEYEYTTEDFAEEFFGGTDSPGWEALFP